LSRLVNRYATAPVKWPRFIHFFTAWVVVDTVRRSFNACPRCCSRLGHDTSGGLRLPGSLLQRGRQAVHCGQYSSARFSPVQRWRRWSSVYRFAAKG
jgi:hypothetical protein